MDKSVSLLALEYILRVAASTSGAEVDLDSYSTRGLPKFLRVFKPNYEDTHVVSRPKCVLLLTGSSCSDIHAEMVRCAMFPAGRIPLVQDYCNTRDALSESFMKESLYQRFCETFFWNRFARNDAPEWHLFAIDGSDVSYMQDPDEPQNYIAPRKGATKGRNSLHLNCLSDTETQFIADTIIQNAHEANERLAELIFMDRLARRFQDYDESWLRHIVLVTDRGYEAWHLLIYAIKRGISVLCRVKSPKSNAILRAIKSRLPENKDEYVATLSIKVTTSRDKAKADPNYFYVDLSMYPDPDLELNLAEQDEYTLTFNVVKVKLDNGTIEYLITNIIEQGFTVKLFKNWYWKRWTGSESTYGFLKDGVGIEYVHAKSAVPIRKELWGKITLWNYVAVAMEDAAKRLPKDTLGDQTEADGCIYRTQIKRSDAVTLAKSMLMRQERYDLAEVLMQPSYHVRYKLGRIAIRRKTAKHAKAVTKRPK